MPITIQYDDYIHQGTNIRDMRSRVATIQIRLHSLRLDTHAHNKMKQLLEEKYDVKSDIITLSSDR
jgi:division protein CdvB (Snf7/Vps24/ESCRT-III family)